MSVHQNLEPISLPQVSTTNKPVVIKKPSEQRQQSPAKEASTNNNNHFNHTGAVFKSTLSCPESSNIMRKNSAESFSTQSIDNESSLASSQRSSVSSPLSELVSQVETSQKNESKASDKQAQTECDLLIKQLEDQQLASLILKTQLQYNLSLKTQNPTSSNSSPDSDLLRTVSSSPSSNQEKSTLSLSESPLFITSGLSSHINNQEQDNSPDEIDNEILLESTSKHNGEASGVMRLNLLKFKKFNGKKKELEFKLSNDNGNDYSYGDLLKVSDSIRTPKSALLERRRKAVHELLLYERYPSGEKY